MPATHYSWNNGVLSSDLGIALFKGGQKVHQPSYSLSALSATTPTFTLGPNGTPGSQITGSALVSRPLDADNNNIGTPYTYMGGYNLAFGTSGVDVNQIRPKAFAGTTVIGPYTVKFGFSGDTQFEIRLKCITNLSFRMWIDGQLISESEEVVGGTAGQVHGLLVDGLDSGQHMYQFDFPGVMWFGGIYMVPTASIWPGDKPAIKAVLLSDSTGAGANGNGDGGAFGSAVWWRRFCQMMDWEGYNASQGGTGMIASSYPYINRMDADVTAQNPDVIVIAGSRNDNPSALADVQAAAVKLYTKAVVDNPQALVIATGPWFSTSSPAQGYIDANTATRAAAAQVGVPFIDQYTGEVVAGNNSTSVASGTVLASGMAFITGTGYTGATASDGNADTMIGSDDVHPTLIGHQYYARRMHQGVKTILNSLS